MNERLFRPQFNQMGTTEKQALMESLAARYDMTFLGLHTFDRWGQSCTTGVFEKDGREFVFVPGDTVTLGNTVFTVLATPGHTPGGVCYIAGDCIFSGDTLFFCSCGRTDFPGGSSREIMDSLQKLAALPGDYTVYPGHDRFSTLNFERQHNPYMKKL